MPNRVTHLLLLAAIPVAVSAAPVPRSLDYTAAFTRTFGATLTPDEGTAFEFDGKTLTAKFPKGWYGSWEDPRKCLRTEREVVGDFDLTVAVRTTAPAVPPKVEKGKACHLGGGLAVWEPHPRDSEMIARTEKGWKKEVNVCRYFTFAGGQQGWSFGDLAHHPGVMHLRDDDGGDPGATTHLRITRRGDVLATATSADGEKWSTLTEKKLDSLAASLSVGVWAFEATNQGYEVRFEQFTLTPTK